MTTPTPEMIAAAERVLAKYGPVMVACGNWRHGTEDDGPDPKQRGCAWGEDCVGGQRPMTATELATPDGDRPGAELWALAVGAGEFEFTYSPEDADLDGCVFSMSYWGKYRHGATATEAMLKALDPGDE